ncbi:MAG: carbohydrate ABC transporter permease, partial [Clostridia bacterium]|nr:carbohydrate ABC transporter permease [Clostridia bacterium]
MEKTVDRLDAPYIPIEHGTRWQRMMHWLRNPRHVKMLIWGICRYVILLALSYIVLTPFIFMISMSIRSPWDNLDPSVMWIPRNYSTQVFAFTFRAMAFWRSLWETMKIGVFTGVLQVIVTCVVGYGFARFKFPGRGLLFAMVLFTLIVPMPTILSGFYMLMHDFRIFGISTGQKLLDTYLPFWLPALFGLGLRSAIFIYFYRQFFRGQPKELSEAATVDGCGYFGT